MIGLDWIALHCISVDTQQSNVTRSKTRHIFISPGPPPLKPATRVPFVFLVAIALLIVLHPLSLRLLPVARHWISQLSMLSVPQPLLLQSLPPHPILPLLLQARASWKAILDSQPTSLAQARAAYLRRHHPLSPPPGFDAWFAFAQSKNFTLIDRFDGLMNDLAPFRSVPPDELRRRTFELATCPGVSLIQINSSGNVSVKSRSGRWAPATAIKDMLTNIVSQANWPLPSLEFAINEKSQAKVLPRQSRLISSHLLHNGSAELDPQLHPSLHGFKSEWGQDGNIWDAYRRACPPDSAARRLLDAVRSDEAKTGAVAAGGGAAALTAFQKLYSLPTRRRQLNSTPPLPPRNQMTFLPNLESFESFCNRPSTRQLHSAFFTDQRSIEHLFPLFSPSKPQGFADIILPSHYHYRPTSEFTYEWDFKQGRTSKISEPEWEDKIHKLYWHGKLTMGADTPPGHTSSFQKQRLVKIISNETEGSATTSQAHRNGETDPSRRHEVNRILYALHSNYSVSASLPATIVDPLLLDVAIACEPGAGECDRLHSQGYLTLPPRPLSESWKSKIVLDLDEVGFSPRFGALMESKSAVVKMSVQQEFWRDWVQPWIHFLPLSSSFSELHNLLSFFLGIPKSLSNYTVYRPLFDPRTETMISLDEFVADDELRKIGLAGRDWKRRHMRTDDMEVYLFRLMIEWARIVSGNLSATSSSPASSPSTPSGPQSQALSQDPPPIRA